MWTKMSFNQKQFFNNQVTELQNVRYQNTLFAGLFGMVIGIMLLIEGGLLFVLRSAKINLENKKIEWNPDHVTSRGINKIVTHEKCQFPHLRIYPDKQVEAIRNIDKKKTTKGIGLETDLSDEDALNLSGSYKSEDFELRDVNEDNDDLSADYDFDEGRSRDNDRSRSRGY